MTLKLSRSLAQHYTKKALFMNTQPETKVCNCGSPKEPHTNHIEVDAFYMSQIWMEHKYQFSEIVDSEDGDSYGVEFVARRIQDEVEVSGRFVVSKFAAISARVAEIKKYKNDLLETYEECQERITELEAALSATLPSLLALKAKVERSV